MTSGGKGAALREQLLAQAATRYSVVKLGGDSFRVREVEAETFAAYAVFLAGGDSKKDPKTAKARREQGFALVLAECVVDDDGVPYLSAEDAAAIAQSARVAFPLVNRILEISGFSGAEKKDD